MDTKQRILLVDDEAINLEFFEVMLTKFGFDTEKADTGYAALEAIKRHKPDLVILDNIMPGLSGWEVTKLLKTSEEYRDFAEIPIIMFSAMDDVKDKVEGLELGADDYITKPFNFSEVLARIRAVLRAHELVRQIERREARIRIVEEIGSHVLAYSDSLKEPLAQIIAEARGLAHDCGRAEGFVNKVLVGATETLQKIDTLNTIVDSLRAQAESLHKTETALPALKKSLTGKKS